MLFNPSRRARSIVAGLLVTGVLGSTAAAATIPANAAGAPPPTAIGPGTTKSTVPKALARAETAAEDVIGYLEKGQPAKSKAEARILRSLARGAAAQELRRAGVPDAQVKAFQRSAERTARLSLAGAPALQVSLAANDVSALMPGFYGRYHDPVPPAVLRLDHLDRQAQLRSQAGQTARSKAAVHRLEATWRQVRPQVVAAGGATVARSYDAHVAALAGAGTATAVQKHALHGLDLVDQLEKVFLT